MLVVEEHLHGSGDFLRAAVVDRGQNPRRFSQDEMRYPGPSCNEDFSRGNLLGVIPRDQPNQYLRVNGSHDAS